MENQQIGGTMAIAPSPDYLDKQAAVASIYPARTFPRTVSIEELEGGFVVNLYDQRGNNTRFVAHNARLLGRKLKEWADPTPAVPPAPAAPVAAPTDG